jgi:O-acetylserine/cysteine efflux transporter
MTSAAERRATPASPSLHAARLPLRHALLALAVVAVWGSNFAVIKTALVHLPPLLLGVLRFSLVFLPAALFLPRPAVRWRNLAAYGMFIGAGQFGLLYFAMGRFISPGLASLVIQTQVFFTIGLSMLIARERVQPHQLIGLALGATGIVLIATHTGGDISLTGLVLILCAAASWACGNLVGKRVQGVNMLAYVVWSGAFAVPPLLLLSLAVEGWPAMQAGLQAADTRTWLAVVWQAVGNSLFGYAAWSWLLSRHPAATVVPMALLVPVFGMAASAWFWGEALPLWKLGAAALVMGGLAINLLGGRWLKR